jgi:hypothetical protein
MGNEQDLLLSTQENNPDRNRNFSLSQYLPCR